MMYILRHSVIIKFWSGKRHAARRAGKADSAAGRPTTRRTGARTPRPGAFRGRMTLANGSGKV
eukprot:6213107-Pleurochrysis_carterae.AAC.1